MTIRLQAVAIEQDRADPERASSFDVVLVGVADHGRLVRRGIERAKCSDEDRRVRLDAPMPLRAHDRVDFEPMVRRELVEIALAVRHETDLDPVTPQLVEHGQRVLVQREVLVPLPLAHHVSGALAGFPGIAAHPEDDLLRERDPDLLVVHELVVALERLDRSQPRVRVEAGLEREPVPLPHAPVPLRPQLRPGPKQGEVDVEQDGLQHSTEDSPG